MNESRMISILKLATIYIQWSLISRFSHHHFTNDTNIIRISDNIINEILNKKNYEKFPINNNNNFVKFTMKNKNVL